MGRCPSNMFKASQKSLMNVGLRMLRTGKRFKIRHLLLLTFLIYVGFTLVSQQMKLVEMSRREDQIRQEIERALEEQAALKREIELLHTDDYVEALARDELGLIKPGEIIYKFNKDQQ